MYSDSSDSDYASYRYRSRRRRYKRRDPIADRIDRALNQNLLLLHRAGSTFYILGDTGNVYTVVITTSLSCTCPDAVVPCKHILFTMIEVLGVDVEDSLLRRSTLRPSQIQSLLSTATMTVHVARPTLRRRFHEVFFEGKKEGGRMNGSSIVLDMEEGITCPVCLDEMGKEDKCVACNTCKNPIHENCLAKWKKRSDTCVFCRAKLSDGKEKKQGGNNNNNNNNNNNYVNLSAYVGN